jgi:hypothetical protein
MDMLKQVSLNESNDDMILKFIRKDFPKRGSVKSGNLEINREDYGWSLINYGTLLAYISDDDSSTLYFNEKKYSQTTSRIQNSIRLIAIKSGMKISSCDPEFISEIGRINLSNIIEKLREVIIWVFTEYNEVDFKRKMRLVNVYLNVLNDRKN